MHPRNRVYPRRGEIAADDLSRFLNNRNRQTTHESSYTMENMLELYDIKEISDGTFMLSFNNIIYRYQREYPLLMKKNNCTTYQTSSFRGGQNTIKPVMYEDKIIIPQKIRKYAVKWYHMYLLNSGMD